MNINSISPMDGRYNKYLKYYNDNFSELAFIKNRVLFEIDYFLFLISMNESPFYNNEKLNKYIKNVKEEFIVNLYDNCIEIKEKENIIHHDVKSIEYFLADKLKKGGFNGYVNLLHFGLTSQDVNTIAYSISIKNWYYNKFFLLYDKVTSMLKNKINKWEEIVILGRTHGQPATWTSLGKEFSVYLNKLKYEFKQLRNYNFTTKLGGSVGNLTSHMIFNKSYDWKNSLNDYLQLNYGLTRSETTTQIHNYNEYSVFFDSIKRMCSILVDMCSDIWLYCSLGELTLIKPKEFVGSSIMPHKVNPIEFENAEGNLKIAIMWLEFLSRELCVSRLQRDLTDSTILRNLGVVFSHVDIGFTMIEKGFKYLKANEEKIEEILLQNLQSMSEIEQHILRKINLEDGYNAIKSSKLHFKNKSKEEIKEKYKNIILDSIKLN